MKNSLRTKGLLTFILAVSLACSLLLAQSMEKGKAAPPAKDQKTSAAAAAPSVPQLTGADLEAFLDGMMPSQLNREDIAGAVIAVVKDGKVIFAKGYGFSDVEKRTPVTPDATLFRPGSISKLFTWTSVMQLSEQG